MSVIKIQSTSIVVSTGCLPRPSYRQVLSVDFLLTTSPMERRRLLGVCTTRLRPRSPTRVAIARSRSFSRLFIRRPTAFRTLITTAKSWRRPVPICCLIVPQTCDNRLCKFSQSRWRLGGRPRGQGSMHLDAESVKVGLLYAWRHVTVEVIRWDCII